MSLSHSIKSVRLGEDLRELRRRKDLTAQVVATELGWSQAKVSRIERGQVRISRTDLKALLVVYGVTDQAPVAAFVAAAEEARVQGWWRAYEQALPREYRDFIALEATAVGIRAFDALTVPALLQTPEYSRCLVDAARPAVPVAAHAEALVDVCVERQGVLQRDTPPDLAIVVAEGALRQLVGGREVMAGQLRRLARMSEDGGLSVQVLPFDAGAHAGAQGSFVLLDLPGARASTACVPYLGGVRFINGQEQVDGFAEAFDSLRAAALGPAQSLAFVDGLADALA